MRIRSVATFGLALVLATLVVRPTVAAIPPPRTTTATGPEHIVMMVFENKEADSIMAPHSDAPFFRSLARGGVKLSRLFAITHPSLPNYLALTSGSTHGITSDCTSCLVEARNLVDQLEYQGRSWKAYMESMPDPCSTQTSAGRYEMKHDPFMYYTNIRDDPARCGKVVPMRQLTSDLRAGSLPEFAWITPNMCHDMHDCPIAVGDRFLHTWVSRILPALGASGILIVVFDEGYTSAGCCHGGAAGGHIAGLIAGPGAASHLAIGTSVSQYSLLRLVEDAWGLRHLAAAATAPDIVGWQASAP